MFCRILRFGRRPNLKKKRRYIRQNLIRPKLRCIPIIFIIIKVIFGNLKSLAQDLLHCLDTLGRDKPLSQHYFSLF